MNGKNQQKGVDALIYRDLMTLSRQRAIAHAFVLSGDEDLREGVHASQELGVRVTLVGIAPASQSYNQSRDLVHEADDVITLEKSALASYFSKRPVSSPVPSAKAGTGKKKAKPAAISRPPDAQRTAMTAGRAFGEQWRTRADESQRMSLLDVRPKIPPPLDAELLKHVEDVLGFPARSFEDIRRSSRRGFWQGAAAVQNAPVN